MNREIVIASRNKGKIAEILQIFADLPYRLRTLADFPDAPEVEEKGATFVENARLKAIAQDKNKPMEERFSAALKLAELPRNSSATRIRNRCEVTGRPRAYYRKHRLSRIALRELGSKGLIPGLLKSSW